MGFDSFIGAVDVKSVYIHASGLFYGFLKPGFDHAPCLFNTRFLCIDGLDKKWWYKYEEYHTLYCSFDAWSVYAGTKYSGSLWTTGSGTH